ncbi:hypothetical protein NE237_016857 [Protea cynaroides]|uniref:Uncharacterized protein n=1 Tax=Protea cynaroides TaxID=273540 RepID=A0A9Q0HEY5_9MAGN|nr:hypothetical protein NE237_016857 [Protea cynaroides]
MHNGISNSNFSSTNLLTAREQFSQKHRETSITQQDDFCVDCGLLEVETILSRSPLSADRVRASGWTGMAVVLSNLAVSVAATSSPSGTPDRKAWPVIVDMFLNLPRRDLHSHNVNGANVSTSLAAAKGFDLDGEHKNYWIGARHRANSKANTFEFDAYSGDEDNNNNGNGDEDNNQYDWEEKLWKRVKELEEMKELEKKAEELQSRMANREGEGQGKEETEEEKRMRVKRELEKAAKENAEKRATAKLMFELGQKAYGKGMYSRAIEFLEGALTIIPGRTLFGGEIQIWLAMAYEANNRHTDCISLYQQLEKKHPSVSIRRQAAELRYILQAPKLKISAEEMVTIPLIGSNYDSYAGSWSDKYKDRNERRVEVTTSQLPSSRDYLADFLVWRPPGGWEKNQAFWIAVILWLGLVGVALFVQR